uniref:Cation-transporting ATPase n=1 Tax=Arion vulgaris TaxID=1028688 RepID=A0A0B7AE23_9EUPU
MNNQIDSSSSFELSSHKSLLRTHCILNKGTDEELSCWGYTDSTWKKCLYWLLVFLSLGTLLLIVHWKPELTCYLQRKKCPLYKAKYALLMTRFGIMNVAKVCILTEPVDGERLMSYTDPPTSVNTTDTSDDRARLSSSWLSEPENGMRYFDYQHTRYIWDNIRGSFTKLEDLSIGTTCYVLHEKFKGLSDHQRAGRLRLYGPNTMDIEVLSYWSLFIGEVLNPFYIFQIASIILWAIDYYYYYAGCIFFISALSIGISLREIRRQRVTLKNMVSTAESTIKVSTDEQVFVEKHDHELVPGDLIAIPANGCVMTCDAVLTAGTCIVNESMLTGESVPVTKTPLLQLEDEETYSPETHKRHTLFSGTRVVQTRYYGQAKVTAVVVRTGFNTAKGELVRAILFPKPLDFAFYRDAVRFILFLAVVASMGMIYSLVNYIIKGENVQLTILRCLDIITIIVPPALPAAMTVGTVYAQSRLKKSKIFCISPPRINFCGTINVFCFDKTGTLTEDGLDLWGVVPAHNHRFQNPVSDPSTLSRSPILLCMAACHSLTIIDGELSGDPLDLIMFNAIKWYLEEPGADAHKYDTIMPTVVKPCSSEIFLGEEHPFEVGIIRQFPFSSASQRMSVITRTMGESHMESYCKGAPEKIASLCKPETVPHDFHTVLHSYSIQGFRVIALAYRPIDPKITWHQVQRISRDKVENDLIFLGLLVMQNQLKPQTTAVIQTLKRANVRSVMVTGDMIQTAISVGRNCGMVAKNERVIVVNAYAPDKEHSARIEWEESEHPDVTAVDENTAKLVVPVEDDSDRETAPLLEDDDNLCSRSPPKEAYNSVNVSVTQHRKHLAVSGKSFHVISDYFPELLPKICVQGTIFARMSPEQKCQLIEQLQKIDYTVGMCGDGANDCEALKAAHAGISLSEAEASVAAPFTSSVNNIECVVIAMREGRAALVTSFGCFKYMALYSFIQFISVLILYTSRTNLSDFEFLYTDLIITTSIAILMGNTAAYHKLVKKTPPGSLVSVPNLISIISQVVLSFAFQLGAYFYLHQQSFYSHSINNTTNVTDTHPNGSRPEVRTWDSTVIFLLSSFMYLAVAFTFSKGPPFRKPIYTNVMFLSTLVVLFVLSTLLLLCPWEPILNFFDMMPLYASTDFSFRLAIYGMALAFMVMSVVVEWIVIDSSWLRCLYRFIGHLMKSQPSKYKVVCKEIKSTDWPRLGQVTLPSSNQDLRPSETYVDVNPHSDH